MPCQPGAMWSTRNKQSRSGVKASGLKQNHYLKLLKHIPSPFNQGKGDNAHFDLETDSMPLRIIKLDELSTVCPGAFSSVSYIHFAHLFHQTFLMIPNPRLLLTTGRYSYSPLTLIHKATRPNDSVCLTNLSPFLTKRSLRRRRRSARPAAGLYQHPSSLTSTRIIPLRLCPIAAASQLQDPPSGPLCNVLPTLKVLAQNVL